MKHGTIGYSYIFLEQFLQFSRSSSYFADTFIPVGTATSISAAFRGNLTVRAVLGTIDTLRSYFTYFEIEFYIKNKGIGSRSLFP